MLNGNRAKGNFNMDANIAEQAARWPRRGDGPRPKDRGARRAVTLDP